MILSIFYQGFPLKIVRHRTEIKYLKNRYNKIEITFQDAIIVRKKKKYLLNNFAIEHRTVRKIVKPGDEAGTEN